MIDLLIGTSNAGKLREYGEMIGPPFRLLNLRDVGLDSIDLEEPYDTFEENALHKARSFAIASNRIALADDSGLAVDALGGRPGVYSARYAPGSDADRYNKLLGELQDVPEAERTARFVCVVAASDPEGDTLSAEGIVEGRIAFAPGPVINGFGYDAVFIPQGYDVVFSALPPAVKNQLSHRGIALRELMKRLERWARS
ncbi:MAG: RdgB/HAM1 family non-canonical purine NTP pyrophosphatase [Chloroflexi bacterium]|nr:RdgB/HAM1 family non-canonical purine NTP pyrophosphatase [Chloroflexota bacterium]